MLRRLLIGLLLSLLLGATGCSRHAPAPFYPDPERYLVRGLDISAHNGEIDFNRVKAGGYEFVYIKATEGASFRDRRFIANVRAARQAGLKVGAYHFFRFDMPGYLQGLNLASAVEGRNLDLPVVIDIEEWTNPNAQATPLVVNRLLEMIDHLESRGLKVMIYTNKNGYSRFIRELPRTLPLWICSLGAEPDNNDWTLWQASHSGIVDGVSHPVDINAFHGSDAEWQQFIKP
ncbi:MAG: hypothetical protein NC039_05950 [Muribaculaceae bacterium]|nr:hypothetical protein [Muribaculaceae bacterium]